MGNNCRRLYHQVTPPTNPAYINYPTRFGNNVSTIPILLDVLMVLPEEIGNRALRLGANQRQKWKQIFGGQCGGVLQLLSSCLGYWPNDEEIKTRVRNIGVLSFY